MKYVALLRGINIGGRNKVDMGLLAQALEQDGFEEVSTYINSGNIFVTSSASPTEIVSRVERVIQQEFDLQIKVLMRDNDAINELMKQIPDSYQNNSDMKCDIMFLWEDFDNANVLGGLKVNTVDEVTYSKGAIIWRVDREHLGKSGMNKLIGTKLYKHMTVRNVNTVRKIWERLST